MNNSIEQLSDQGQLVVREVGEWSLTSTTTYANPFTDVEVDAEFIDPDGGAHTLPGFYDGDGTWRVRFSPHMAGEWRYRIGSAPADHELAAEGSLTVAPSEAGRGFLRATPDKAWGFSYESGEPMLLLGDTVYNLFAETFFDRDISGLLDRRKRQGFNLLRTSLLPQPLCPPNARAWWADRKISPWADNDGSPDFTRFDLDYFRAVDRTVRQVADAGLGLEMIIEFSLDRSPFLDPSQVTPEVEELWIRYVIARYDAYPSVYFWNLCNEYEYIAHPTEPVPAADQWALRTARRVKELAAHGHPVAVHNRWEMPPFAQRFADDLDAIDVILYQVWGTTGESNAWLAAGIDEAIDTALAGWPGSAMNAEYGYETDPGLRDIIPIHQWLDPEHTRRGAWRSAFRALGVTAGFHQSWWGFGDYSKDQPGVAAITILRRFLLEIVNFAELRPAPQLLIEAQTCELGTRPAVLAVPGYPPDGGHHTVVAYLPVGGSVSLDITGGEFRWFNPRTGELGPAEPWTGTATATTVDDREHPADWALVISA